MLSTVRMVISRSPNGQENLEIGFPVAQSSDEKFDSHPINSAQRDRNFGIGADAR
jgi:hypothetical protein